MKEIQAWLGHSDYSTTANLYAHLDVEMSKITSAQRLTKSLGLEVYANQEREWKEDTSKEQKNKPPAMHVGSLSNK